MPRRETGCCARAISVALLGVSCVVGMSAAAADDSFTFEATSPHPYTPAYLGNGVISLVTTPLGTEAARSFLAGVYDHTLGDVPRIASAPAWNEVDVYNGSHWLNALNSSATIDDYRQTLDMYNGILRTSYVWVDGNKKLQIHVEQFVSRNHAELAAARVTITPEFSGKIAVRLPLRNWSPPHRYALERIRTLEGEAKKSQWAIWYPGHLDVNEVSVERRSDRVLMSLLATAPGTGVKTGEAVEVEWSGDTRVDTHKDPNSAEVDVAFDAQQGQSRTLTKFAAIVSSPSVSDIRHAAVAAASGALKIGWDRLLSASAEAWHRLWETDIVIEGDPNLQRTIHSMLFYLLGSAQKRLDISIGPMGLSSAGYCGHIFWDADIFMFPSILILHPELARSMVAFRSRTLPAARENAIQHGYKGAMYPWEAGPDGAESTPRFAGQNASSENHINGDVALAAWQYWAATGDRDWLQNQCWPILRDTADFWVSRVSYDAQHGRYEIAHVVGVNESQIGISNDAYTNAVAKKNIELAIAVARELHLEAHPKWHDVAQKMYVPDSDSALLWYPLDRHYSPQQTHHAIETMLSHMQNRVMRGTQFYAILAAQLRDQFTIGKLLGPLSIPYLRPPFHVVAETPVNQNTNFITGTGAFLQQFIFGYTGLRLGDNGLERQFPPTLPPGIRKITLKNVTVRRKRETLVFDASTK